MGRPGLNGFRNAGGIWSQLETAGEPAFTEAGRIICSKSLTNGRVTARPSVPTIDSSSDVQPILLLAGYRSGCGRRQRHDPRRTDADLFYFTFILFYAICADGFTFMQHIDGNRQAVKYPRLFLHSRNPHCKQVQFATRSKVAFMIQEALLPQTERTTRYRPYMSVKILLNAPEQSEVMELEGYSRPTYNKIVHSAMTRSTVAGVIHSRRLAVAKFSKSEM